MTEVPRHNPVDTMDFVHILPVIVFTTYRAVYYIFYESCMNALIFHIIVYLILSIYSVFLKSIYVVIYSSIFNSVYSPIVRKYHNIFVHLSTVDVYAISCYYKLAVSILIHILWCTCTRGLQKYIPKSKIPGR